MSDRPATFPAMVLAAGLGTRMRPITDHTPKPLVEVGGRTMLDWALDHLDAAGVQRAVVNLHHLPERVVAHLSHRDQGPRIDFSDERSVLLETGGGIKKALPLLGPTPFLALNADIIWLDGSRSAVGRLMEAWDPARMDALLLLVRRDQAHGYQGRGDFGLADPSQPSPILGRPEAGQTAPFIYAGVQILTPGVFADSPDGPWSLNIIFNRLLSQGRLFGMVHDGDWFHVGTPDAIAPTSAMIAEALLPRR